MENQKLNKADAAEVSFSRVLVLFDASMIGIGIFVLTGLAAGEAG